MVKATLLGLIVACLAMMWGNRDFVTEAYQVDQDLLQVRLSGVDLDVALADLGPSPYVIPAPSDTRRSIMPVLSQSEPIENEPPPQIDMSGGEVTFSGKVVGPEGPVAGAIVGIERLTSDGIGELRLQSNAAGTWQVEQLPGGRYRVRAWKPGELTSGSSEVRFVVEKAAEEFDFTVVAVDPTPTLDLIHGGAIYAGHSGTVAVVVTQRTIDADGIMVTAPVSGALVSVHTSAEVSLTAGSLRVTDEEGSASFTLRCLAPASGGRMNVTTGLTNVAFRLPGCRAVPPPPPKPKPKPANENSTQTTTGNAAGTSTSTSRSTSTSTSTSSSSSSSSSTSSSTSTTTATTAPAEPDPETGDDDE